MRAAMSLSLFRNFAFVISLGALVSQAKADGPTANQLVGEWAIQAVTLTTITTQGTSETKDFFKDSKLQGGVVFALAEGSLVGNNITIIGDQKRPASPSSITPQEAAALFGQMFASSEKVDLSPSATGTNATVTTRLSSNPALAGSVSKTYSLSGDTLTITTK